MGAVHYLVETKEEREEYTLLALRLMSDDHDSVFSVHKVKQVLYNLLHQHFFHPFLFHFFVQHYSIWRAGTQNTWAEFSQNVLCSFSHQKAAV